MLLIEEMFHLYLKKHASYSCYGYAQVSIARQVKNLQFSAIDATMYKQATLF